jgi:phosphoglycolate phosphatase-like HAD superfamily hydrolase
MDRWAVERLEDAERRARFRATFDSHFWTTVPAIAGAVDACHRLHDAGYELICVSALDLEHEAARLRNLRDLGFPIERVVATGNASGERSPKADAIEALRPIAFVDDYLPYLRGLPADVHTALVLRAPNGSPNTGAELALAKSTHEDLAAFATHWLGR